MGVQAFNYYNADEKSNATDSGSDTLVSRKVPAQYRYIPAVINAILVIIFTKVYNKIAMKVVLNENHRY